MVEERFWLKKCFVAEAMGSAFRRGAIEKHVLSLTVRHGGSSGWELRGACGEEVSDYYF